MDFQAFRKYSDKEKCDYFGKKGDLFHFVMAQQLKRDNLEALAHTADLIRAKAENEKDMRELNTLLSHKRAILFFNQPSTRTFFSFINACYILGISVSEVRDPAMTSVKKGESFEDSIRTFASYADMLIMRNSDDDAAEKAALTLDMYENPIPVINAGSGKKEHPTQALLDIYTLMREFSDTGGIDGKKIVMAGDLKRGRTVRSLCRLISEFKGVKVYFAAVPEYQMKDDIKTFLTEKGVSYEIVEDFKEIMSEADAVYMTRVQDEHDTGNESAKVDFSSFYFKYEYLNLMKPGAVIMHPLPRREEIPDEVDKDPRAAYWRQEENGLWIRAALIAAIFNADIN